MKEKRNKSHRPGSPTDVRLIDQRQQHRWTTYKWSSARKKLDQTWEWNIEKFYVMQNPDFTHLCTVDQDDDVLRNDVQVIYQYRNLGSKLDYLWFWPIKIQKPSDKYYDWWDGKTVGCLHDLNHHKTTTHSGTDEMWMPFRDALS